MKRHIATTAILLAMTVGTMAQQREFPAMQINFKDGTSQILTYPIAGYRYGVENPKDGDYITCYFEQELSPEATKYDMNNIKGNLMPVLAFTQYGLEAIPHCETYGVVLSDAPIDMTTLELTDGYQAYAIINGTTIRWAGESPDGRWDAIEYPGYLQANDLRSNIVQELGKTYYLQAYYMLDGKMHYSKQVSQRVPKKLEAVIQRQALDAYRINDKAKAVIDHSTVRQQLNAYYGLSNSLCLDSLLNVKKNEYAASFTEDQVKSQAYNTDPCDDGNIYYLNLPESTTQSVIAHIEAEANTPFYVKATPEVAITTSTSKTDFTSITQSGYPLVMVDCDASWGVRDNQYLFTNVEERNFTSPVIAIRLNHLMLPGKKYNVTFSLAPQTDPESADTQNLECYVLMADGLGEKNWGDTYPKHQSFKSGKENPYFIKNPHIAPDAYDSCYIFRGYADKVTTYTFEYTPETLVFSHAFKVQNRFNLMMGSTKAQYGQNIRLIGVEVSPVEEEKE